MPCPSSAINAGERAASNVKRIVGENIKARRIALNLSQEELAKKFGVSRTALSQYEIGVGEVNAGDLPRLASILGISTLAFYKQPDEAYLASYEAKHQGLAVAIRRPAPIAIQEFETTVPQFQDLSELMLQIAQLTTEEQETVRRMIVALQSARTAAASQNVSHGIKRVAKRVSKKK